MISKHGTLTASTMATVTLTADTDQLEVVNVDGADIIYFTVDGPDVTVAMDGSMVLPKIAGASLCVSSSASGNTVVKLISAGTPKYAVTDASDFDTYERTT